MNVKIVKVDVFDNDLLSQIAQIHIDEVPSGFLTALGPKILTDMYMTIAQSKGSFLIALITSRREVLGFIACSVGDESLYKQFLRQRSLLSIARLMLALMFPSRMFRIFETLRYSEGCRALCDLPRAEILNFCVAKNGQRKGLGRRMIQAAENIYRDLGVSQVRIVTGHSQIAAQEFYRKLGAQRIDDVEIHKGTLSTMFIWDIKADDGLGDGK